MKRIIIKSVDNFENELGGKIINQFLINFKKEVMEFYSRLEENPLLYREKNLFLLFFQHYIKFHLI